jgi:hypothetical protein
MNKEIRISVNSIYFVLLGDLLSLEKIVEEFNANKNSDYEDFFYLIKKIKIPISMVCDELSKQYNVTLDTEIEKSQCYIYADHQEDDLYFILLLEKHNLITNEYKLCFPKLDFGLGEDPEKIICQWLKKKIGRIPKCLKKTLKPEILVGKEDNIMVFSGKYKLE